MLLLLYIHVITYLAYLLIIIKLSLQLIRDEIRAGKSDKEIYKKLEEDYGETVLYAPKFDLQTAALWLSPVSLRRPFNTRLLLLFYSKTKVLLLIF